MNGVLTLLTLIILGTMLADALSKPAGTTALFNGLGSVWKTGVNGVLGKTS